MRLRVFGACLMKTSTTNSAQIDVNQGKCLHGVRAFGHGLGKRVTGIRYVSLDVMTGRGKVVNVAPRQVHATGQSAQAAPQI